MKKRLLLFGLTLLLTGLWQLNDSHASTCRHGRVRYSRPTQMGWPIYHYRYQGQGTIYYNYDFVPFDDRDTLSYGAG